MALYHALPSFRGKSRLSTWIYRITKNRCLNRIKFLKRRRIGKHMNMDDPAVAKGCVDGETRAQDDKDPHRLLLNEELSEVIQRSLERLPEKQRAAPRAPPRRHGGEGARASSRSGERVSTFR